MMQELALCRMAFALTLVATQVNAGIDLDSIPAFLCVAFLRLVMKNLHSTQHNARVLRHIVNWALVGGVHLELAE